MNKYVLIYFLGIPVTAYLLGLSARPGINLWKFEEPEVAFCSLIWPIALPFIIVVTVITMLFELGKYGNR
jgi:hypothetical protein